MRPLQNLNLRRRFFDFILTTAREYRKIYIAKRKNIYEKGNANGENWIYAVRRIRAGGAYFYHGGGGIIVVRRRFGRGGDKCELGHRFALGRALRLLYGGRRQLVRRGGQVPRFRARQC